MCYHNRSNYPNAYVGIKTTNPKSSLVVSIAGNALITAENTGDFETRQSIINRVKDEVPADKLSGAVLFFNGDTSEMEVFLPVKGEFRTVGARLLTTVAPIKETFEVKDRYYFDRKTGNIKKYKVRKAAAKKFRIKVNYELDFKTGKFFRKIKDKDRNVIDKIEVSKEEAVGPIS